MSVQQKKALRVIYWGVEINLVFWLAVLGQGLAGRTGDAWPKTFEVSSYLVVSGLILAAAVQHWGYYRLRASVRGDENRSEPEKNEPRIARMGTDVKKR